MSSATPPTSSKSDSLTEILQRYWGFETLRPLQAQAIEAGRDRRDSLVVMPTGGGKSLCYQVPPILGNRTDIVVSPLISLMKDQVDGLRSCGYPAAAIHSHLGPEEKRDIWHHMQAGAYRLVFVAPERLLVGDFLPQLVALGVKSFAIDEAHCISHWGHDFRPEYRRLAELKKRFPGVSIHAFTATATPRVRQDIIDQLELSDPAVLVGNFDRPNLTYRVIPRVDVYEQTFQSIQRHRNDAAIVYCVSRKDTEKMAVRLKSKGIRAEAYHAGLAPDERQHVQDDFSREKIDVVCATVAFGMGIDRSDVRLVAHAAMPKSIEHYQQETGRAGRDGLPAECVLFYSPADVLKWESIITSPRDQDPPSPDALKTHRELLNHMRQYAASMHCRHEYLSEYFGQRLESESCGACDVCLDEIEGAEDATELARMILSCIYRVGESFGVTHVCDVLCGSMKESVQSRGHDQLTTHGLLKSEQRSQVQAAIYQLIDRELIGRTTTEFPTLYLNESSWKILRGEQEVLLHSLPKTAPKRTTRDAASWDGVDRALFDELRAYRRQRAAERGVPPYQVFSDATLRDVARLRPRTLTDVRAAHGIGDKKLADFGDDLITLIESFERSQAP